MPLSCPCHAPAKATIEHLPSITFLKVILGSHSIIALFKNIFSVNMLFTVRDVYEGDLSQEPLLLYCQRLHTLNRMGVLVVNSITLCIDELCSLMK